MPSPTTPASLPDRDDPGASPATAVDELFVVQFKGSRKGYYHNRAGLPLAVGQYCFVEADRGRDLGRITYRGPGEERWWRQASQKGALAEASEADVARLRIQQAEEPRDQEICREKIAAHGLPMELVGAERQFDGHKITFYFIAEGRIDFRQLVRDLAAIFRTRIELRQIGVRDEAKLKGGVGICGRECCCASFMHDFVTVSLRMAKDQQLSLNPSKLSGLCGRLRCCLVYEHADYKSALAQMPRVGAPVTWRERPARVRKLDIVQALVTIHLLDGDGDLQTVPVAELAWSPSGELGNGETGRNGDPEGNGSIDDGEAATVPATGDGARRPRRRGGRRRGGRGRTSDDR